MTTVLAHNGINHTLDGAGHASLWQEHGVHIVLAVGFLLAYLILLARERTNRRTHEN